MKHISTLFIALVLFASQARAQLVVFGDDYAAGVTFSAFGGSTNTLSVDNSQHHSGTASLKIPVTTNYTGGALVAALPQNLSSYNALTFWAKNDNPAFKLDGAGLGNNATTTVYAVEINGLTVTSTWTKFVIPIPVPSKLTAETGLFHFAEGSGEGAYNIWIDDIQYETVGAGVIGSYTAAFATEIQNKSIGDNFNANGTTSSWMVNGVEQPMQTAKAYFTWASSNNTVATMNALGVGTALTAGSTNITATLGAVAAGGVLTVNVAAGAAAPATAAPTPNKPAADVISLFSNAYTNHTVDTWSTNWSAGNHELTDLQIAGNDTKKYVLHHFAGVEFITSPVDATNYDFMHIDVWTPTAATPFTVRLVDFNGAHTEADVTNTPATGTWVGYNIPLASFATLGARSQLSQLLFLVPAGSTGTFFIDNVYFYKTGVVVPTDPTVAAPTPPARNAADVISLFSGAYTDLAATDWFPNWGQSTVVTETMIAGNPTKKYVNFNYQGVQFANPVDASGMTKLHLDIWTPDAMTFDVYPIVPGQPEVAKSLIPVPSQWNSYDIDLATIGTAPLSNIIQFKFVGTPSGSKVYIDNVYFYKGTALPVTLSDFNVTKRGNASVLNWKTHSEINSKGFAVERSSNGAEWSQLQFINSGAGSSVTKQYSVVDKAPLKGINYYRLKQIDNDGRPTLSSVVSLKFSATGVAGFSFYPNPAKNKITVLLETIESRSASLQLINAEGKMVRNVLINNGNSNSNVSLDVSNLPKGVYYISLKDGPGIQTTKVLIN